MSKPKQNATWKDIPGYEGLYQISDDGRVYSLISNIELKQNAGTSGYLGVGLHKDSTKKTIYIHQMVSKVFLGDQGSDMVAHHKNHNKLDNRAENMEYMQRNAHATMHTKKKHEEGRMTYSAALRNSPFKPGHRVNIGKKNGMAKLDDDKVREIFCLSSQGVEQRILSEKFNVSITTISDVISRKLWTHVQLSQETT